MWEPAGSSSRRARPLAMATRHHAGTIMQVLALRQENDRLKSALADLLNSPLNRELLLPPTLLLR